MTVLEEAPSAFLFDKQKKSQVKEWLDMKWREFWFMVGGVFLGGLVMVIFFQQGNFPMSTDGEEVAEVEATTADVALELKLADDRQMNEPIHTSHRETAQRAELIIDEYFDPERILNRDDVEYHKKLLKHRRIGDYLYSSRRYDPAFQEIMILLLEHGYSIEEWSLVIQNLGKYKARTLFEQVATAMKEMIGESNASPEEVENWKKEQEEFREGFRQAQEQFSLEEHLMKEFGKVCNIADINLIRKLWEVDIGLVKLGDGSLGEGRPRTAWGARLLKDEDWLTEEFREAQVRFDGTPPERIARPD